MYKVIFSLFLLISVKATGQKFMSDVATNACVCLKTIPDTLRGLALQTNLGTCMLESVLPYRKQFKKEYDIDVEREMMSKGKEIGGIVAVHMAQACPNEFKEIVVKIKPQLAEAMDQEFNSPPPQAMEEGEEDEDLLEEISVEGDVVKIEKEFFVSFSVKDKNGNMKKYYWFSEIQTDIDSNLDLEGNYESLTGKRITLSYIEESFFDPKIGEYRNLPIITHLSVVPK